MTTWISAKHSNQLSYSSVYEKGWNRTTDRRIFSPVLYQLSYFLNAQDGTRTHTERILSPLPLPIGLQGRQPSVDSNHAPKFQRLPFYL